MTTLPPATTPTFHVRSNGSAVRGLVIAAIWVTLVVGFVAQIMGGASPRHARDQQAAAPAAAVSLAG